MAERPEKRRGGMTPRDEAEEKSSRQATRRATTQQDVDTDPREDDGWTQPESSSQKGAARDEEEG